MREVVLNGTTAFLFNQVLFDSRSDLPVFTYAITATYTGTDGRVNNCNVVNGTNVAADGSATSPTGNITSVQVAACTFPVTVSVAYSGTPAVAMGAGGVTLELRDPATGNRAVVRDPLQVSMHQVPPLNIKCFHDRHVFAVAAEQSRCDLRSGGYWSAGRTNLCGRQYNPARAGQCRAVAESL